MASVIENMTRAKDDLLAIKDAVIATGVEVPDGTPSSLFADKVAEVYEKGKSESSGGGDTDVAYNEGYTQGKTDEQRAFWETYQQGGERCDYSYVCRGAWWTDEMYNPQHPFNMNGTLSNPAYNMFANSNITDTKQPIIMNEYVIKTGYVFHNARKLKIIRGLTVDEAVVFASHWFQNCVSLEEFYMGGTIGTNGFDVHWSTLLNHDSIVSIINCLSSTTTDLTVILSLTAVNNAFETSKGAANGSTSEEWLNLVATKENWTISLA